MKQLSKKLHGLLGMLLALALMVTCVLPAFAATTDNNGVAFEKSITNDGEVSDSYTLKLNVKGKDKVTTTKGEDEVVTKGGKYDVVFVLDLSDSMTESLTAMKNAVTKTGGLTEKLFNADSRAAVVWCAQTETDVDFGWGASGSPYNDHGSAISGTWT
ncbi:MAG: hypothetical protein IJ547_06025, partial [Clostridia bacterium]|nr:hypothetical protein [Clostridia bacterium]